MPSAVLQVGKCTKYLITYTLLSLDTSLPKSVSAVHDLPAIFEYAKRRKALNLLGSTSCFEQLFFKFFCIDIIQSLLSRFPAQKCQGSWNADVSHADLHQRTENQQKSQYDVGLKIVGVSPLRSLFCQMRKGRCYVQKVNSNNSVSGHTCVCWRFDSFSRATRVSSILASM